MKKLAAGMVATVVGLSLLTACTGGTSGGTGNTIKIGLAYELSGAVATYGQDSVVGVQMAADEINAAGGINGKKIELVKVDTQSDPAVATTVATRLATQDKVLAIIGPATSGSFKAMIPVANQNKVPLVSGSATADGATVDANGKAHPFAFRTCFSDSFQGTAMANFALNTLNAKTAVIFGDNSSDYAKGLAAAFKKQFTAKGGTIVDEQAFVAGDTDFNATLTKLKNEKFDVLYLPGYYQEAGLIIKAARGLGINVPVLGADGFDSPTLLELGGAQALNNVYFTNHYSSLSTDPKVQEFIAAFKAKNGKEPNSFNAMGYDTMKFVADAIKRAQTPLTGQTIATAMAATKDFPAVTGTLSIDESHNAIKQLVVVGLKDGVQATSETVPVS